MTIEEIKKWVADNQRGLIVGVIVGVVLRSILR